MSRREDESRTKPQQDRTPGLETDPRFPSGPWTGFWVQTYLGRQWMALHLRFKDGKLLGDGVDCIGKFVFTGRYDLSTGKCELIKSYLGRHDVEYRGQNDNDGLWLWGLWRLTDEPGTGGFHVWPAWESDPTQRRLKAEQPLRCPRRRARRRREQPVPALSGDAHLGGI